MIGYATGGRDHTLVSKEILLELEEYVEESA